MCYVFVCLCVCVWCMYVHMLACVSLYVDKSEDKEVVRMAKKRKFSHCVLEIVLGHSGHLIFHLSLKTHLLIIY